MKKGKKQSAGEKAMERLDEIDYTVQNSILVILLLAALFGVWLMGHSSGFRSGCRAAWWKYSKVEGKTLPSTFCDNIKNAEDYYD